MYSDLDVQLKSLRCTVLAPSEQHFQTHPLPGRRCQRLVEAGSAVVPGTARSAPGERDLRVVHARHEIQDSGGKQASI